MSTVVITINSVPVAGSILNIGDSGFQNMPIEFVDGDFAAPGEVAIGVGGTATIDQLVYRLYKTIGTTYNVLGIYSVYYNYTSNTVTIEGVNAASQFSEVLNTTSGAVTISVDNTAAPTVLTIDTIAITGGDCNNVEFTVTTNVQADSISLPISQVISTNPFVFTVPRSGLITFRFDIGTIQSNMDYAYAPPLLVANFTVNITPQPSGGSIVINDAWGYPITQPRLTLEYSIDGINYFGSNSFSGLTPDTYTAYIRDNLGCEIQIPFTIDAFAGGTVLDVDPIVEVSNCNPFRFKIEETWADCSIRKNVLNTLSSEEPHRLNFKAFKQLYQTCDVITNQIKTNYQTIEARLYDCDANESIIPVTQKTNNMNRVDVRDAQVYNIVEGQYAGYTALLLNQGNLYDPDTQAVIGSYDYGESLPSWIEVGGTINMEGVGWFNILEITYFLVSSIEAIIIDAPNTHGLANYSTLKATSIYSIVDYERHEFTLDMSQLTEGCYLMTLNITDTREGFVAKEYVSEWFCVKAKQTTPHHVIQYYNTKANELNYSTGMVGKIRLPYVKPLEWSPAMEEEVYVTDTKTIQIESPVREFYKMILKPLPTAMAQKVVLILAHNRINIDGISYLVDGGVEATPIGVTNMYKVSANLVKSDYVFDSGSFFGSEDAIVLPSGSPLEIDDNASGFLLVD